MDESRRVQLPAPVVPARPRRPPEQDGSGGCRAPSNTNPPSDGIPVRAGAFRSPEDPRHPAALGRSPRKKGRHHSDSILLSWTDPASVLTLHVRLPTTLYTTQSHSSGVCAPRVRARPRRNKNSSGSREQEYPDPHPVALPVWPATSHHPAIGSLRLSCVQKPTTTTQTCLASTLGPSSACPLCPVVIHPARAASTAPSNARLRVSPSVAVRINILVQRARAPVRRGRLLLLYTCRSASPSQTRGG